jgi:hypothetical protein
MVAANVAAMTIADNPLRRAVVIANCSDIASSCEAGHVRQGPVARIVEILCRLATPGCAVTTSIAP